MPKPVKKNSDNKLFSNREKDGESYVCRRSNLKKDDKDKSEIELNNITKQKTIVKNDEINEDIVEEDAQTYFMRMKYGKLPSPFVKTKKFIVYPNKKFSNFEMSFGELLISFFPFCKGTDQLNKEKIYEDCGMLIDGLFDIEKIISIVRESEEIFKIVLTKDEISIIKHLTTPKIEIKPEGINLQKIGNDVISSGDVKDAGKNYLEYACAVNKLLRNEYLSNIELQLLKLHIQSLNYNHPTTNNNINKKE